MQILKTRLSALLLALPLVGCASQLDCASSLCGCYTRHIETVSIQLADSDGSPIGNARLMCHDDGSYLGTTNPNGILKLRVKGSTSPGCGFMPECQIAYFQSKDDGRGRPFWFARLVRNGDVQASDEEIRLIDTITR